MEFTSPKIYTSAAAQKNRTRLRRGNAGDFLVMGLNETGTHIFQIIGLLGHSALQRQLEIGRSDTYGTHLQSRSRQPNDGELPRIHTRSAPFGGSQARTWEHLISVSDTLVEVNADIHAANTRRFNLANATTLRHLAHRLQPLPDGSHRLTGSIKLSRSPLSPNRRVISYAFMSIPNEDDIQTLQDKSYLRGAERSLLSDAEPGVGLCLPQFVPGVAEQRAFQERPIPLPLGADLAETMLDLRQHLPNNLPHDLGGVAIAYDTTSSGRITSYQTLRTILGR